MITRMPPYDIFVELPKIANQVREISEDLGAELDFAVVAMEATFGRAIQKLSTGEANGWISVDERLPEIRKRCLVEVGGQTYAAYLEGNGWFYELWRGTGDYDQGMWRGPRPTGNLLTKSLKDYQAVTRWRELPPAPTSVPQAEPPK